MSVCWLAFRAKRLFRDGLLMAAMWASCAVVFAQVSSTQPMRPTPSHVEEPLGRQMDGYFAVDVLFASDRQWDEETGTYGAARGRKLSYGWRVVSVPADHEPGKLESPGLFRSEKPEKHVAICETKNVAQDEFLQRLRAKLRGSRRRELLLFVHGAITTFDFSSRRVAQIAHDIGFDGPVILYSWPSEGRVSGYLVDKANAEWTQPHLTEFLRMLAAESGAERIHVLSHSMGVNLFGHSVRELQRAESRRSEAPFDQVLLAAGDMDVEVFARDFAPYVSKAARRVTIYVSDRDRALAGSRKLHKYPRLGDGEQTAEIAEKLDNVTLVDVSEVAEDWSGHEYYGGNPAVLVELRGVLAGDAPQARGLTLDGDLYRLLPTEDDD